METSTTVFFKVLAFLGREEGQPASQPAKCRRLGQDVPCGCKMLYLHVADLLDVFVNMRHCEWWRYLIMSERVCNHESAADNLSKQRHLEFMSLTQFMPQHPGNTDSIKPST